MIRKSFVMQLQAGQKDEYKLRHNPIWPELEAILKSHGVHSYSIFYHSETSQLFAYAEIEDEDQWQNIAKTEVCKKWWDHMSDIMDVNADNSPAAIELEEVFYLD